MPDARMPSPAPAKDRANVSRGCCRAPLCRVVCGSRTDSARRPAWWAAAVARRSAVAAECEPAVPGACGADIAAGAPASGAGASPQRQRASRGVGGPDVVRGPRAGSPCRRCRMPFRLRRGVRCRQLRLRHSGGDAVGGSSAASRVSACGWGHMAEQPTEPRPSRLAARRGRFVGSGVSPRLPVAHGRRAPDPSAGDVRACAPRGRNDSPGCHLPGPRHRALGRGRRGGNPARVESGLPDVTRGADVRPAGDRRVGSGDRARHRPQPARRPTRIAERRTQRDRPCVVRDRRWCRGRTGTPDPPQPAAVVDRVSRACGDAGRGQATAICPAADRGLRSRRRRSSRGGVSVGVLRLAHGERLRPHD